MIQKFILLTALLFAKAEQEKNGRRSSISKVQISILSERNSEIEKLEELNTTTKSILTDISTEKEELNTTDKSILFDISTEELTARTLDTELELQKWDFWCQVQPVKGKCPPTNISNQGERYYFDQGLEKCERFNYSGCNANRNNFHNYGDCNRRCSEANPFHRNYHYSAPLFCFLQIDIGMCFEFNEGIYFDLNERKCKTFLYSGCGGNQNRFRTMEECNEACHVAEEVLNKLEASALEVNEELENTYLKSSFVYPEK